MTSAQPIPWWNWEKFYKLPHTRNVTRNIIQEEVSPHLHCATNALRNICQSRKLVFKIMQCTFPLSQQRMDTFIGVRKILSSIVLRLEYRPPTHWS